MRTNVPTVGWDATVLEASRVMNESASSGVAVFDGKKVAGVVTDRRLLMTFLPMNKAPDKVKVSEVMAPLYRIDPDATPKEAVRKIIRYGITRLGVYDGEQLLGWVSLTDLSRYFSRSNVLETLRLHEEPEPSEFLCFKCRSAFMEKTVNSEGNTVGWRCPKCGETL